MHTKEIFKITVKDWRDF